MLIFTSFPMFCHWYLSEKYFCSIWYYIYILVKLLSIFRAELILRLINSIFWCLPWLSSVEHIYIYIFLMEGWSIWYTQNKFCKIEDNINFTFSLKYINTGLNISSTVIFTNLSNTSSLFINLWNVSPSLHTENHRLSQFHSIQYRI